MADLILGIDLGTTNSEVAVVQDGKPRVILVDGDAILPSVVGLGDDGKFLVGKPARNQYVLAPERTAKSVKRQMGENTKVTLGDQQFRPQEISAVILKKLKEAAEQDLGHPVSKAVVTVPAYFNDSQRQATREAGELAGLNVVRILNEPTAAALTYNPDPNRADRFLVYDLGGGTFDVSIVQAENGVFEVLSSHGDTQLGGDDFDDLLLNKVADDFAAMYQVDLRGNRTTRARLLRAVENAKKTLSDHAVTKVEEEFIAEKDGVPLHLSVELARTDFEDLIRPLIDRTMDCVQKALTDAKVSASQIGCVVLVGGSTRSPIISKLLEEKLGQPAHREVHPDLCVALGAGVQAALIAGQNVGSVLVDITPHSLGIKSLEYPDDYGMKFNQFKFAPVIKRNTPLPASRSELFGTVSDNQQSVIIEVFQGENGDVRKNHRVGKFTIEGLAKVPAGNQINVQMDLTLDGLLKVSARERATGLVKQITIEHAVARFAVEEREEAMKRLDRLWAASAAEAADTSDVSDEEALHIRDLLEDQMDDEDQYDFSSNDDDVEDEEEVKPPRGAGTTVETEVRDDVLHAKTLLERADRLRTKASTEDQAELDKLSGQMNAALTEGKWDEVKTAAKELANVLFYIEDA
jgi:molecular chaperone DnaK